MNAIQSDVETAGLILLILMVIALMVAGSKNKVVIFYDVADMWHCALIIILPLFVLTLSSYQPFITVAFCFVWKWSLLLCAIVSGVYYLFRNFSNAIRHNRSVFLGLFIGVFKLIFLVFAFVVIYSQMGERKDRPNTFEEKIFAWGIIFCVLVLGRAMINGRAVYENKGWDLPVAKRENALSKLI
ncbi:hypothetical protein [Aquitalea sp. ASV15]|uniref:hypothetical protein n=1 Tax=Aquitalea sp. ASV15 TaxID=2795104 RepID=UPI0018ECCDDE|nr:hypothetical protein [Aquitalea sp. ASV15]